MFTALCSLIYSKHYFLIQLSFHFVAVLVLMLLFRTDEPHGEIAAHESSVWTLAWHPVGHILCSGSNDHTTKFWCRNRPGDTIKDKYNVQNKSAAETADAEAGKSTSFQRKFIEIFRCCTTTHNQQCTHRHSRSFNICRLGV